MNRSRDQFLAGSTFTHNENGAPRTPRHFDPLGQLPHRGARSDEAVKVVTPLARKRARFSFQSLNSLAGDRAFRTEISIRQNNDPNVAQLVE